MKLLSTYAAAAMALETTNAFQAFSPSLNGGNRFGNPRSAFPSRSWSPWGLSSTRRRPAPSPSPLVCSSQTSDVTTTAAGSTEASGSSGGAHGGVRRPKTDRKSFVQWDMRRAAMKLHTRDQAPKEGKQENKGVPFAEWRPSR